ncbi:hypothetical protein OsI_01908 [Oryza sativa Indica Group]|uniref:Retrotransposon gag domain-containing protein n=1 Tax=Oryza sativa subsp. indica TaxID=39946 RepID=A2WPX6_ORYSI|nr:hypothetical protein OsI_01908 [Oryza sativa Indica Group]
MGDGDDAGPAMLPRASQKLVAAATLIRAMPEPSTPEARSMRRQVQALVEEAAFNKRRAPPPASATRPAREPEEASGTRNNASIPHPGARGRLTVQTSDGRALVTGNHEARRSAKDRLIDTRGALDDGDVRNVLNRKRQGAMPPRPRHPQRGGRYDSEEDKSPTPGPPGTPVFSRRIRSAAIPPRFRQPTTITKYSGETKPETWLNDYRLACQLGGATDDAMIIRNLPLHLADSARTWLEHTYPQTRSTTGTTWSRSDEPLRDFIRRFSKRCTELPSVGDSEIIHAFLEGTTCQELVREQGRNHPTSINALFDIATNFASGEEAVAAIFDGKTKGKRAEGSKPKAKAKKQKRGGQGKKPRQAAQQQQQQGEDSDDALVVERGRKGPRGPPQGEACSTKC